GSAKQPGQGRRNADRFARELLGRAPSLGPQLRSASALALSPERFGEQRGAGRSQMPKLDSEHSNVEEVRGLKL
ncbi:MAG TPA: hypothetical protein VNW92_28500, partial [Polyangiaceae bacterium]|nr:hypothetical protein [Polyangiaceae bacterium]